MKERVYFIYNFSNRKNALSVIAKLEDKYELFYFNPFDENKHWKKTAKSEMKKCDKVISYVYKNNISQDNENLNFELKLAKKLGKSIEFLPCDDWKVLLDKSLKDQTNEGILLKEYELMLKTTETLEDLRQKTSNFYVSIMTALMAIVGSSFALKEFFISFIVMTILGLFMFILNLNWWKSIKHYHDMNYVKFEIINELENKLNLSSFNAEYALKNAERLPSFKRRERFLVNVFIFITFLMIITGIVGAILIRVCK